MPDLQLGGCGFAPRSTQPFIPPGSVNEYQLRLRRQRQVWLIPIGDETHGVQADKTVLSLDDAQSRGAVKEDSDRRRDVSCGGATQIDYLYVYLYNTACSLTFRAETFQFLEVSGRLCDAQVSASVDGIDG